MYSGEYDACDVTLSVYPHRASLKNMPGTVGIEPTTFGILAHIHLSTLHQRRMITRLHRYRRN
jgi:hypothetical protein